MPTSIEPDIAFLSAIIDNLQEHIVVLGRDGTILYVNEPWRQFGNQNGPETAIVWPGQNYLAVCDQAASGGDRFGARAASGIRKVLKYPGRSFYFEYPCHSPDQQRWFMMRATRMNHGDDFLVLVSHSDITERRLAEERVEELSRLDSLTGINNRRSLEKLLASEWNRCRRKGQPISLAMVDIDHFKLFNDHYGHQAGDNFLRRIAHLIASFCKRPGDHCARYGGEEFILVFGNTDSTEAEGHIDGLLKETRGLGIPHEKSPSNSMVTISAGLSTCTPGEGDSPDQLIQQADESLYEAKAQGRDRLVIHTG